MMKLQQILLSLFVLSMIGMIVTLTVVYAKNPCCNTTSSEKYVTNHDLMATSGGYIHDLAATRDSVSPNVPGPEINKRLSAHDAKHAKIQGKNRDLWARHGWHLV